MNDSKIAAERQAELEKHKAEFFARGGQIEEVPSTIDDYEPLKEAGTGNGAFGNVAQNIIKIKVW